MMVAVTITGLLGQGMVQVCSGEKWTEAQDWCVCVYVCLYVFVCLYLCACVQLYACE